MSESRRIKKNYKSPFQVSLNEILVEQSLQNNNTLNISNMSTQNNRSEFQRFITDLNMSGDMSGGTYLDNSRQKQKQIHSFVDNQDFIMIEDNAVILQEERETTYQIKN